MKACKNWKRKIEISNTAKKRMKLAMVDNQKVRMNEY